MGYQHLPDSKAGIDRHRSCTVVWRSARVSALAWTRTIRLQRSQARFALGTLAVVGTTLGVACLLAAGPLSRLAGMPEERRSLLGLRLFGIRELCLGLGLYRAARADDRLLANLMTELLLVSQVGDVVICALLAPQGSISKRTTFAILSGAPPTVAVALAIRGAYSRSD